jgi:spermidine synthase
MRWRSAAPLAAALALAGCGGGSTTNQCAAYRSGKAAHFVELDPDGEVIRTH